MNIYSIDWVTRNILIQIKKYKTARKENEWDYATFKDVSDELSELLVFFGPEVAKFRTVAEQAKADREHYFEERRIYWHDQLGSERGNATIITAKATLDTKGMRDAEIKANGEYYKAKEIVDRIDQELNSISRRLKEMKHDSDQKGKY